MFYSSTVATVPLLLLEKAGARVLRLRKTLRYIKLLAKL